MRQFIYLCLALIRLALAFNSPPPDRSHAQAATPSTEIVEGVVEQGRVASKVPEAAATAITQEPAHAPLLTAADCASRARDCG
jgi:hypothetical protein